MPPQKTLKYIFVSGGVVSGLGKGITAATLGLLLKAHGLRVTLVKIDMYLNIDAGTIRPQEHGEVFVTADGEETDQDVGHYERFTNEDLSSENYVTTGQIYQEVINKERAFYYEGEDVEAIPHVTDEIIRRIDQAAQKHQAEMVIIELGGTVGELQNAIFFEANRILKLKYPKDVLHVQVVYLPFIPSIGELKSKPAQTSVRILNSMGIQPDFLIARAETWIDQRRLDRLAVFCSVPADDIINAPDVKIIYEVPANFAKQNLSQKILKKLGYPERPLQMGEWWQLLDRLQRLEREVKIAVVGKYFATGDYTLADSYVSVVEALKHAAWWHNAQIELAWIDSEKVESQGPEILNEYQGLVIPGGFGQRGTGGMIQAIRFAREKKLPFLGLCYGLQMAVIEFARNVLKLTDADTTENNPKTSQAIIHVMPDQEKQLLKKAYGGTMRLGGWPAKILPGTLAHRCYTQVNPQGYNAFVKTEAATLAAIERHRHRYEVNNDYREALEKNGLTISGTTPEGQLVEIIELQDHPFFLGTQFHPEFQSRPLRPHPLFLGFLQACLRGPTIR